uniref:Uncharacterized protein n=1 Tax=Rhizophora mucronata TaxID=61149 RepID=A0A2P2PE83_RHIMU
MELANSSNMVLSTIISLMKLSIRVIFQLNYASCAKKEDELSCKNSLIDDNKDQVKHHLHFR